jgi:hypothetical protein
MQRGLKENITDKRNYIPIVYLMHECHGKDIHNIYVYNGNTKGTIMNT